MFDSNIVQKPTNYLDIYQSKYILRGENIADQIKIDRISGVLAKESKKPEEPGKIKTVPVHAVYGIVHLKVDKYLLIVTKSNFVGNIYNKKIFQIEKIEYFPINTNNAYEKLFQSNLVNLGNHSLTSNVNDDKYIGMINSLFHTKTFYFSNEYDLTVNFQTFFKNQFDISKYNPEYCFNECFLIDFIKVAAEEWITPIISGNITFDHCKLPSNLSAEIILISRRSKNRCGVRFISRGCDVDGNPTNFAETEQMTVIIRDNQITIYSFVQTRGSMPFMWQQKPTLKWAPKGLPLGQPEENQDLLKKHFDKQVAQYGPQVIVNLIDKKGTQKVLGEYFQRLVQNAKMPDQLNYVWFDFHHECRNMKWENLKFLVNIVKNDIKEMGHFEFTFNKRTGSATSFQRRVIRTNCMDCLDRTNVVQSVFARTVLHEILGKDQIIPRKKTDSPFEPFPEELELIFRESWTKNADVISVLYTGTGALKTDFTRTGKRTKGGAVQDGRNSLTRYVLNNFYDAYKQNSIDLLLGKLKPHKTEYKAGPINNFVPIALLVVGTPFLLRKVWNISPSMGYLPTEPSLINNFKDLLAFLGLILVLVLVFFISLQRKSWKCRFSSIKTKFILELRYY